MAENMAPPPAKRMRYNLRSSPTSITADGPDEIIASNRPDTVAHQSTAYKLRSHGKINDSEIQCIEPKRKRKKPSLLMLNMDCLLELFDYMTLVDLCAMADTCTTLQNYAKYHFRLKHKIFDFASMFDGKLLNMDEALKLLRIFGDQIQTLKVSRDLFESNDERPFFGDEDPISVELLESIAANCQKSVTNLALFGIDFQPEMMVGCLSTLFNRIEVLALDNCFMSHGPWCNMNNLKVLKLHESYSFSTNFWRVNYDQLEEVEFNHVDTNTGNLSEFLRAVPTIKRLTIVKCWSVSIKIFEVLSALNDLEELDFQLNHPILMDEIHRQHLAYLTSLKKLKVLKLSCNQKNVQHLIDGFREKKIAIEHLELVDGLIDLATVQAITGLKTIKVLKFNDMIDFSDQLLGPIANRLHQLEEFHIKTTAHISQFRITQLVRTAKHLTCLKIDAKDFDLNADTYRAILAAVQNRTDKNHLAITIYGDGKRPGVELNGPNGKWLKMKKLNRNANHLFPLYPWTPEDIDFDDDFFTDEEFEIDDEIVDEEFDDGNESD